MSKITKFINRMNSDRFARGYATAIIIAYGTLVVASPATAQSIRATGETIFNTIYGLVGVIGGICILCAAINWKLGGIIGQDPKKFFINSCAGTGLAFGTVAIVQFIKSAVSTGGGISGV